MINLFKRLTLPSKLILIGLIPSIFLVYLSIQFYSSEKQKLDLFNDDIQVIDRSTMVTRLLDELQEERRFAYEYALKKEDHPQLVAQRVRTDSVLNALNSDPDLKGFEKYTMLGDLQAIRKNNDAQKLDQITVMSYYTTAIFRISMLEVTPQLQIANAGQLNSDLHGARALSQIITYLGILRANIYNVMFTRQFQYGNGTLIGLYGVYQVYSTYQTEFNAKASPQSVADYQNLMQHTALKPLTTYLTASFKTMKFDSTTYTDVQFWQLSGNGVEQLRGLQNRIWTDVSAQLNNLKRQEQARVSRLLMVLVLALFLSTAIITLTIISITRTLNELRRAAEKIAVGETGLTLNINSDDVIGELARSISLIDNNNKMITGAADEIRKGNFGVSVRARGDSDILGNSLLQMKNELQRYTREKLEQAAELERLLVAVKASENYFRQIADQTPFMIWQVNDKGEATYVNKQWIDFTGLSLADSQGTGWVKALHPDDIKERTFAAAFNDRAPFRSKARFKNQHDEYSWTLIQADPIYDNGEFEGYIGSITDISDQVAAQQAVIELMDKKDEFLTVASHELKTPLTSIKAYTQLLKKNIDTSDRSYSFISKTLFHIDRLEKLVKDLLDVSRINSGQMLYDIAGFRFDEMLGQTVEHFRDVSGRHQVIIENSAPAQINGDRARLEQVLNNLMSNAVKYSPDADRVMIRSVIKDGNLLVSVQDFGVGIEEKDMAMLFDKFYRTEKTFYKFQGLGLGLFISNEIISRHQGKIWAESEPGKGATFYFTLPLA